MRTNRVLILLAGAILLHITAIPAWATNGNQFIGIGAYGKGMGGAVTAAPFDSTTAISNPAGLTEIGGRADYHFEMFQPKRSLDWSNSGGGNTEGGSNLYLAPSVGWSAPINDSETLFFGGGMFLVSGMGVDYYLKAPTAFGNFDTRVYSQYQFWKIAPTLAKKVNDKLSVGAALNIDYQQMAYRLQFFNGASNSGVDLNSGSGALGYGFTIGALYEFNDQLSGGITYISKQDFGPMEYRLKPGDIAWTVPSGKYQGLSYSAVGGVYSWDMDFPAQYAVGLAYKPTPEWQVTFDYKKINFSDTFNEQKITGSFTGTGNNSEFPLAFGWKDVSVIAVALQYQFSEDGWLRAAYSNGNSPIDNEDTFNNVGFPAITEKHTSFGFTKGVGRDWEISGSYMIAGKNDLSEPSGTGAPASKISLEETSIIIGISYIFKKKG